MKYLLLSMTFIACVPAAQAQLTETECGELCLESSEAIARWGLDSSQVTFVRPWDQTSYIDDVLRIGWNVGANGVQTDPSLPAFYSLTEAHYEAGPDVTYVEWHLQYRNGQVNRRPISVAVDHNTHRVQSGLGGSFELRNSAWIKQRLKLVDVDTGLAPIYLYDVTLDWATIGHPMIRVWHNGSFQEVLRTDLNGDVVLRDRVKIAQTPPIVTSCEDLAEALSAMGLVDYQP